MSTALGRGKRGISQSRLLEHVYIASSCSRGGCLPIYTAYLLPLLLTKPENAAINPLQGHLTWLPSGPLSLVCNKHRCSKLTEHPVGGMGPQEHLLTTVRGEEMTGGWADRKAYLPRLLLPQHQLHSGSSSPVTGLLALCPFPLSPQLNRYGKGSPRVQWSTILFVLFAPHLWPGRGSTRVVLLWERLQGGNSGTSS